MRLPERISRSLFSARGLASALAGVGVVVAVVGGIVISTSGSRGEALSQGQPAAPVEVEIASESVLTPTVRLIGSTEPHRSSLVAAAIEGYVIEFSVDEGQRVAEGDVLARLRDRILLLQLAEAEAVLSEARENHANALRDLERARPLVEKDAVTEQEIDAIETRERTLKLRIPQFESRVAVLRLNIAKKTVKAPFAGQIDSEFTEIGEWVERGGPVARVVDVSKIYLRVNVPERYVRFVQVGDEVNVRLPAVGDEPRRGKVVSVADSGDSMSRTFPVRIELVNDGTLRAGLSGEVELAAGVKRSSLVVSKDAILIEGTRSFVFVVDARGLAERRAVRAGISSGTRIAILDGVVAGDRVIVRGNERVRPGLPVRIVDSKAKAAVNTAKPSVNTAKPSVNTAKPAVNPAKDSPQ